MVKKSRFKKKSDTLSGLVDSMPFCIIERNRPFATARRLPAMLRTERGDNETAKGAQRDHFKKKTPRS
jgi:hypothetical protein